ncbi:SLC13 family permease [Natronogracilivirga saccharolytica]|nr:SLC13 family permease [Natronogracilivirga saccharolytica]
MKSGVLGLTPIQITGLFLGIFGLILPFLLPLETLSTAGQLGMGIFLMAAVFWMFEPIPIYATSMLVIFLQIILLSAQGPVYMDAELPVSEPVALEDETWQIPASALQEDGTVLVAKEPGETESVRVNVIDRNGQHVIVQSDELSRDHEIVTDPGHRLVDYEPNSYTDYIGTLANPIIILFLGGFMLARASVKYNLDKNLTRYLLGPFGTRPRFIVLGLMLVTAALSAFMSNTATAAMMVTVILPIIAQLPPEDRFKFGLALSIPIAANVGGITTPIGTPPNAIVIAALSDYGIDISFTDWIIVAAPLVVVMLVIAWFLLLTLFPPSVERFNLDMKGKLNVSPKAIGLYVIFGATVLLWITENQHGIPSSMVAFLPVAALVTGRILNKEDIQKLPWEVLWLMAGGISLGIGMDKTGLAVWMISGFDWGAMGYITLIIAFSVVAIAMSNFLSNTVTATLLMPLVISLHTSGVMGEDFNLLITGIVIAVACSLAMALPISTPPNAIAMSTGIIRTKDMAKMGVIIGVIGLLIILAYAVFYWPLVTN